MEHHLLYALPGFLLLAWWHMRVERKEDARAYANELVELPDEPVPRFQLGDVVTWLNPHMFIRLLLEEEGHAAPFTVDHVIMDAQPPCTCDMGPQAFHRRYCQCAIAYTWGTNQRLQLANRAGRSVSTMWLGRLEAPASWFRRVEPKELQKGEHKERTDQRRRT